MLIVCPVILRGAIYLLIEQVTLGNCKILNYLQIAPISVTGQKDSEGNSFQQTSQNNHGFRPHPQDFCRFDRRIVVHIDILSPSSVVSGPWEFLRSEDFRWPIHQPNVSHSQSDSQIHRVTCPCCRMLLCHVKLYFHFWSQLKLHYALDDQQQLPTRNHSNPKSPGTGTDV